MAIPDFAFAWEHAAGPDGPWGHLHVVRFDGVEQLSAPYRYDLTLLLHGEVDPADLIGARATLRIATLAAPPYKLVHGILVEAEELGPVPEGMLFRAILMPPLVRARHRTRCRIFLDKTIREIVNAVLRGDPDLTLEDGAIIDPDDAGDPRAYVPAHEKLCWRIQDPSRIDDVRVRPYCVQYNESDLAFVSRMLEPEGISYHFENGAGVCLLVFSDSDQGKARLEPFEPLGPHQLGRHVDSVKLGARLREKKVRLGDYDWRKPKLDLVAEATDEGDLFEYRWPGGYADAKTMGEPLARARLDRYRVEAEYATFTGGCRMLSAGSVFGLEHDQDRYEGEYLVTKLEVHGEQHGAATVQSGVTPSRPFAATFECTRRGHGSAVAESRFRPARVTPRPRIFGSQTAFVTDEPSSRGAEIHVGGPEGAEIGCVRLRFHWDTDTERLDKEPSSCWVRVSQVFAGAGEGALFHPRVGCEVIVEHLEGDPDRPIVTGRVFNGQNRPPAAASGAATVSLMKSCASPGKSVHNEFGFDDTAGSEQIKTHAGKDMNTTVGHDRNESIANDSTSDVGVDRSESTGANRKTQVGATNTETVGGDESVTVSANQTIAVSSNQSTTVGADQSIAVGGSRSLTVGANHTVAVAANDGLTVGGNQEAGVAGNRKASVGGNAEESIGGNRVLGVGGSSAETVAGSRVVSVTGAMSHVVTGPVTLSGAASVKQTAGASFEIGAGGPASITTGAALTCTAGATAVLQAADVIINGGGSITLAAGGATLKLSGAGVEIAASAIKLTGGTVDVSGSPVKLN